MDALQITSKHSLFNAITKQADKPREIAINHLAKHRDIQAYAEILLHEYKSLVEVLSQLDEHTFQLNASEINEVIDKLIKWFDETSSPNTMAIYWAMRHLRQKVSHFLSNRSKN